jgi:hypothetical protein
LLLLDIAGAANPGYHGPEPYIPVAWEILRLPVIPPSNLDTIVTWPPPRESNPWGAVSSPLVRFPHRHCLPLHGDRSYELHLYHSTTCCCPPLRSNTSIRHPTALAFVVWTLFNGLKVTKFFFVDRFHNMNRHITV